MTITIAENHPTSLASRIEYGDWDEYTTEDIRENIDAIASYMMKLCFGEGTFSCYQVVLQESNLLMKQRNGLNIGTDSLDFKNIAVKNILLHGW